MDFPWSNPLPSQSVAVQAIVRRMAASVAIASGLAATGRAIDLAGLDRAAGLLCAQVLDLEPAEGRALRPALANLGESVAALIDTIQTRRRA